MYNEKAMNINVKTGASPYEFPRIAKEMGFSFSLRRGRVDWHKIDVIDIDYLVRERDLVTLQENLINIINYNLENEYDVKILDPNFVKLFKLAQLAIDYLMYSEQHLFNWVELITDQYNSCLKEIDCLKQDLKKKDDDVKNMKRKLKERERLRLSETHTNYNYNNPNYDVLGKYKCLHCPKFFMSAMYLEAHHTRRHSSLPFSPPPSVQASALQVGFATNPPTAGSVMHIPDVNQEMEQLRAEVRRLRDVIMQQDREKKENITNNAANEKQNNIQDWEELYRAKLTQWDLVQKSEVTSLKSAVASDVKELRDANKESEKDVDTGGDKDKDKNKEKEEEARRELVEALLDKDREIAALREELRRQQQAQQAAAEEAERQRRLEQEQEREASGAASGAASREPSGEAWRAALSEALADAMAEAEKRHARDIRALQRRLDEARAASPPAPPPTDGPTQRDYEELQAQLAAQATEIQKLNKVQHDSQSQLQQLNQSHQDQLNQLHQELNQARVQQQKPVVKAWESSPIAPTPPPRQSPKRRHTSTSISPSRRHSWSDTGEDMDSVKPLERSTSSSEQTNVVPLKEELSNIRQKKSPSRERDLSKTAPTEKEQESSVVFLHDQKKSPSQGRGLSKTVPTKEEHKPSMVFLHDQKKSQSQKSILSKTTPTKEEQKPSVVFLHGPHRRMLTESDSEMESTESEESQEEVRPVTPAPKTPVRAVSVPANKTPLKTFVEGEEDESLSEEEEEEEDDDDDDDDEEEDDSQTSSAKLSSESPLSRSLQNLVVANSFQELCEKEPSVLKSISLHTHSLVKEKLRSLGVDPEWNHLPKATFDQKMVMLKHEQKIAKKRFPSYFRFLKEHITKINVEAEKRRRKSSVPKAELPLDENQRKSKLECIRDVALSVLRPAGGRATGSKRDESPKYPADDVHKTKSSGPAHEQLKKPLAAPKRDCNYQHQHYNKSKDAVKENERPSATPTQRRSIADAAFLKNTKAQSPKMPLSMSGDIKQEEKSSPIHSVGVKQMATPKLSYPTPNVSPAVPSSVRQTVWPSTSSTSSSSSLLSTSSESETEEDKPMVVTKQPVVTQPAVTQSVVSGSNNAPLLGSYDKKASPAKSSLRTSSSSTSLTKKRVIFAEKDNVRYVSESLSDSSPTSGILARANSSTTPPEVSHIAPSADSKVNPQTSDLTNIPVQSKSATDTGQQSLPMKSPPSSDSSSSWEVASDAGFQPSLQKPWSTPEPASQFRLRTEQSEKIKAIAQEIQEQLKQRREKPAGGVEAVLGMGVSSAGDLEFVSTSGSSTPAVVRAPPQASTSSTPLLLQHSATVNKPLSEWDLEDFTD